MAKAAQTKEKILVVEDDKFLIRALSAKLKKEGFEVETLKDGGEVLNVLSSFKPDIMLIDLMMPNVDGFTVLEEIRANTELNLPIIVLSNLGQETDVMATKKLGVVEHLVKSDTPLGEIVEHVKLHLKK